MECLEHFFAAGAVIGLARTFVDDLKAGEAAYGILFAAVFFGLALGISFGPKIFAQFSRRRLFGVSLTISGLMLVTLSLVLNLVLAIFITILLGLFAGISWVTGFTMLGLEVEDEVRGRTFAFVQSANQSLIGSSAGNCSLGCRCNWRAHILL